MKTIYLIGFMGTGKSTIGERLSSLLKIPFVDTDHKVEEKYQKTIASIFKEDGEAVFRTYESIVLKEVPSEDVIVSTGGGIVENEENTAFMKSGIVFYLQTSFEEIKERLKNDQSRPLWNKDLDAKEKLFNRRGSLYQNCADHIIYTDNKSIESITDEIIKKM